MPGLGGRLLYAKLKQHNPDLKVLYMSGYPKRSAVGGEDLNPGDPYLEKPFGPEALTRAVREALDA
jgi:two-component SAPR family response regulator